jgi:tripartite-type tricarboxylate transporter receptor subunit TctC
MVADESRLAADVVFDGRFEGLISANPPRNVPNVQRLEAFCKYSAYDDRCRLIAEDRKTQNDSIGGISVITVRQLIFCLTALFPVFVAATHAQDYPSRPILILCGQPAGSGPDTMIRLYADVIGKNVGQRVVVDNRAGAGGIVAASALTQAQPDGYTLLLALGGMHTIVPAMQRLPFDPIKDFDFITLLYASSGLLLVPAANPAKSFSDFVADLKSKSGGAAYGTPGIGSPAHLMSAMLADRLAIPMTHIPYKGGGQIIVDLIAGRMDFTFISSVQAKPHVQEGTVRALAVGGPKRMDWLPDVPTLADLGLTDVAIQSWFGIAAPKDTPPGVTERIREEFVRASNDPLIIKRAAEDSATIMTGPRQQILDFLAYDYDRLGKAVRGFGIKAD